MGLKKSMVVADCTSFINPHYLVLETTNYIGYKIGDHLSESELKSLLGGETVNIKIRALRDSDRY